MRDYWVLVKDGDDPEIELVPEAFSWGAFFFHVFWALYRRLWWVALGMVIVLVLLGVIVQAIGLNATWMTAVNVAEAVALGWLGHDVRRWELGRKGYRPVDIVRARRIADAEELAIARWAAREAARTEQRTAPYPRESELV